MRLDGMIFWWQEETRSLAEARIKRTRAVELLATGRSYDEIARQIGFTNRGRPIRGFQGVIRAPGGERRLPASYRGRPARQLQSAVWAMPCRGRAASALSPMVIRSRIRLYGLDQHGPATFDDGPQVLVVGRAEDNQGGNR